MLEIQEVLSLQDTGKPSNALNSSVNVQPSV